MSGRTVQRPGSLAGVSEIATMFGVSRQRAAVLQMIEGFPRPIDQLRAGPIYSRAEVEAWKDERTRQRAAEEATT